MKTLVAALLFFPALIAAAFADGGAVIASEIVGTHRITVFAEPAVVRAGPVDFSVFVQDALTDEPTPDARVAFTLKKFEPTEALAPTKAWLSPCCTIPSFNRDRIPATHQAAQNKLLQAATVILPTTGDYELVTHVTTASGDAVVPARITARVPSSPLVTFWPVLALPGVAIGLFALRERLSAQRPKIR